MNSWMKSPVIIAALAIFVVGSIAAIALGIAKVNTGNGPRNAGDQGTIQGGQGGSASGIPGLGAPWFASGLMRATSESDAKELARSGDANRESDASLTPASEASYNNFPFALTGPTLSKSNGSITVRISSCSNAVRNLGYAPGQVVTILVTAAQVSGLNAGDWVNVTGITVRGQLVASTITIIPAHHGY